jgi:hypothetical protein
MVLLGLLASGCVATQEGARDQEGGAATDALPIAGMHAGHGAGDAIPCEVQTLLEAQCQSCHGAQLRGGAPMPLVTLADFQQDYQVKSVRTPALMGQTMKMHELVRIRVNGEMDVPRMPQGPPMADTDLGTLNGWLTSGAHAVAAPKASC